MEHGNLVIARVGIQEAEAFKTRSGVNQSVNFRERMVIFWETLFKSGKSTDIYHLSI
jgi:hypothetical protein